LLSAGLLGQYYTEEPMHRSGGANNLLEKQVNSLIFPKDIGTKSLKSGSARTGRDLNTLGT